MRTTLSFLASLPGMPSAAELTAMCGTDPAFPAQLIGTHSGIGPVYAVDAYDAARHVLAHWPGDPAARAEAEQARRGTLADLMRVPGMPSHPIMRRLLRECDDFPVIQRGDAFTPYQFDLALAASFVVSRWRDGRQRPAKGEHHD